LDAAAKNKRASLNSTRQSYLSIATRVIDKSYARRDNNNNVHKYSRLRKTKILFWLML